MWDHSVKCGWWLVEREERRGPGHRQTPLPFSLAGKRGWAGRHRLWITASEACWAPHWAPTLVSSGTLLSSPSHGTEDSQARAEMIWNQEGSVETPADTTSSPRPESKPTCRQTKTTSWIMERVSAEGRFGWSLPFPNAFASRVIQTRKARSATVLLGSGASSCTRGFCCKTSAWPHGNPVVRLSTMWRF